MIDRLRLRGLRARLTVSIAAILVAAVGTTFLVIYRGTGSTLRAEVESELREEATAFAIQGVARSSDPDVLASRARGYVRRPSARPRACSSSP